MATIVLYAAKKHSNLGNMTKAGVAEQIAALLDWFGQQADVLAVAPCAVKCRRRPVELISALSSVAMARCCRLPECWPRWLCH